MTASHWKTAAIVLGLALAYQLYNDYRSAQWASKQPVGPVWSGY